MNERFRCVRPTGTTLVAESLAEAAAFGGEIWLDGATARHPRPCYAIGFTSGEWAGSPLGTKTTNRAMCGTIADADEARIVAAALGGHPVRLW